MRQYQKRYADSTRLCYANYRRWSVIALMVCSLGAQSPQYMNIGRLQAVFMGNFYESYEHAASQYNPAYGNANLLFWPAEYTRTNARDHQGLLGAFGLYLALPDFTDKGGVNHDFYHASVWGDAGPHDNRIRMDEADTYSLWTEPTVTVDGVEKINYAEYVVPVLPAELVIENSTHSEIGLSITRRAYGWSMSSHDDFIIVEYILQAKRAYIQSYQLSFWSSVSAILQHLQQESNLFQLLNVLQ